MINYSKDFIKSLNMKVFLEMNIYVDWLIAYFSKNGTIPEDIEKIDFFETGLIDSFGVIELIGEIESYFNIRFNEDNFQDRRFSTIKGLAEIIKEIKEYKNVGK